MIVIVFNTKHNEHTATLHSIASSISHMLETRDNWRPLSGSLS